MIADIRATDWDPEAYGRFRGLRLRPALDLLAQVGALPAGDLIDLGCGDGVVGPALRRIGAGGDLIGVDASPTMLDAARARDVYNRLDRADLRTWQPRRAVALIFSNAALHWVGDHPTLLPRLVGFLRPGGRLAVQMPGQHDAASHAGLRQLAAECRPNLFGTPVPASVADPAGYARLLMPLGRVTAWETTYVQNLPPIDAIHPVVHFMSSTAMRPILERLEPADRAGFMAALSDRMGVAYPLHPDGSVLMPFRRVFFVLEKP